MPWPDNLFESGLVLPFAPPNAGEPGLGDEPHIDFANPNTALVTLAAIWVASEVAENRGRLALDDA